MAMTCLKLSTPGVSCVTWKSFCCCCSVAKSYLTLCDPTDYSMPSSSVLYGLLEFTQTHVYCIGDATQSSHPLSPPSPPALSLSQHQGLFQWVSSLLASGGQSIGASTLASVLAVSRWFGFSQMRIHIERYPSYLLTGCSSIRGRFWPLIIPLETLQTGN